MMIIISVAEYTGQFYDKIIKDEQKYFRFRADKVCSTIYGQQVT